MNKQLSIICASLTVTAFISVNIALAQDYTPLAPLPGTTTGGGATTNLSAYLSGMIKLLIALGGAFSILMAIIGGTQYIAAGSLPDAKSGAKERIQNALVGLALVLSSYLILNSINPKLVKFEFMLPPVSMSTATSTPLVDNSWPDDSAVRSVLMNGLNIAVKNPSCTTIDQQGCTSVYGLNGNAISGIRNIATKCSGCNVIVTGGTEYWLHKSHNNGRKVDLAQQARLNDYIRKDGVSSITSCGVASDPHYQVDGAVYVDEPNRDGKGNITGTGRHWHVCY